MSNTNKDSNILRLSISKMKTFQQCPKKFYYNYVLKLPKKEFKHLTFGKCCHRVLELYHLAFIEGTLLPKNVIMKDSFKKTMVEYKDQIDDETKKQVYDISLAYLRLEQNKSDKIFVIATEKPFEINIDNKVILNGAIDKIQIDEDGLFNVSDYKTSKDTKYLKNDTFQLETYAYTLWHYQQTDQKWYNKEIDIDNFQARTSYVMLKHNFEELTNIVGMDKILNVPKKFVACANKIENEKEYKPNASALCDFCDFQEVCPAQISKKNNWIPKKKDDNWA